MNPSRGIISKRAGAFDSSGIRKVFDLAARLEDPINLSIGQPDFAMPAAAREAAKAAIDAACWDAFGKSVDLPVCELLG